MVQLITFSTKNVQKFHLGSILWLSLLLISSSRAVTEAPNVVRTPSLSFAIKSAQAAALSCPTGHASSTQTVPLSDIEVCFNFVENRRADLEQSQSSCPCIGPDDQDDEPFLGRTLRGCDNRQPILNLLLEGAAVLLVTLRDLLKSIRHVVPQSVGLKLLTSQAKMNKWSVQEAGRNSGSSLIPYRSQVDQANIHFLYCRY